MSPSLFDQDCELLAADLFTLSGVSVTLRRGETEQAITAIPGDGIWEAETRDGAIIQQQTRTYLVTVDGFTLDGSTPTDPQVGDQIDEVIDGTTYTCEFLPEASEQAYSRTGPDGSQWLLHTKKVGT